LFGKTIGLLARTVLPPDIYVNRTLFVTDEVIVVGGNGGRITLLGD
jgi:hypothetical protein